ncbi:MAG: methionine--tRNA ligase [Chloroflexi bacterium]|nr:methionine--tRNA ligase [Chloroflexota bacterium]
MTETIHISVAWPYANGDLHIGHLAGAYLPADVFARYHRLKGNRVLMVSGSDSHGTPVILAADKEGVTPRELFEKYHSRFLQVQKQLGISYDLFTHTDTENHHQIAQDFFTRLLERGYLYRESQQMLFDKEAERFLPDRFVEGVCHHCGFPEARGDQCDNCGRLIDTTLLIDPVSKLTGSTPIIRETDHYFLDLAKLRDPLREYLGDKDYWRPNVISFARNLVEDLRGRPITRDIDWGIQVPLEGWEDKRLYVWFEAVMGYFTASVEWANNTDQPEAWRDFWHNPAIKGYCFIGKDNIPFHTLMWQAELIGVRGLYSDDDDQELTLPYDVPANEFMKLQGDDFSKSRNRAIWLIDILERYDPDAIRYYIASVLPETRDTDFTWEDFVARNNSELVAWWGNLVNRVLKFAYKHWDGQVPDPGELGPEDKALLEKVEVGFETVGDSIAAVKLRRALDEAMALSREVNVYLDKAPWFGVVKEDKAAAAKTVYTALQAISHLTIILSPFLPFTSQQLYSLLGFEGQLFGEQVIETFEEDERSHDALTYDASAAVGQWGALALPPGQTLGQPQPLFKKLDEKQVLEQELGQPTV